MRFFMFDLMNPCFVDIKCVWSVLWLCGTVDNLLYSLNVP